jgi:diguanylate cyclase (GGDEF)-like protein
VHGQVRRRVYLAICALGLVGCGWQIAGAEGHPLERTVSFPLLAVFLLGAAVVLVRFPGRIRWVEVGGFVVLAAVWLTTMALQLATAPDDAAAWASLFPGVFANLCLLVVLAHLWFDTKWALIASLAGPAVALVVGLLRFVPGEPGGRGYGPDLVGALGYVAVLAMLAFLMARSKEALAVSRAEAARLRELAHTDVLTGLPNRRSLIDALHTAVQDRRAGGSTAVVLFDLDHFKAVNDRYGHDVGDLVLQEVAEVVRASLRPDAVFGRWGGEEFLVVVPRADLEDGAAVAERLRRDIAAHGFPGGLVMTASFGVSVLDDVDSVDAVLLRADRLLYVAKEGGRDLVVSRLPRP